MLKLKGSIENTDDADVTLKVREAQVRQLYKQTWIGLIGVIIVTLTVACILSGDIESWKLLTWSGAVLTITIARVALTLSFERKSPSGKDIDRWANLHAIATFISGVIWGLIPILFLWPDYFSAHQAVWAICTVALSASAVAMYCTWTASYLPYLFLTTIPISIRLLTEGHKEHIGIGILGLIFFAVLARTGKVMHEATFRAFSESIRNESLSSVLAEEKTQIEELNNQLHGEIAKRARSQKELERQNQELERVNAQLTATKNRLESTNQELQDALANVKQLSGLLPICASCKKIRNDKGYWQQLEAYFRVHTDVEFSHGICPDCAQKLYPDFTEKKEG